ILHQRPSPLPELSIQYADFAQWQREWLQGEVLEKQLGYWKEQLGDNPPVLAFPTDRPRPAIQTHKGAHYEFDLSTELTERLRALSRAEGVTLFMTMLAAYNVLLHRYTRQDDISVGTPFANRGKTELEGLIGFFVNMLVLRTDLSGTPSFRELLSRVRVRVQEAQEHQDLPFELLVAELQPERDVSYSPLFQVALVFQTPLPMLSLGDVELELIATDIGTAKLDLSWVVEDDGADGLRCAFRYNTDLFDAATIKRLADHIQVLLDAIVAAPDRPISALPMLDDAERQTLLTTWNQTHVDYPPVQAIHQLFEQQAELRPDAIALHFIPTPGADQRPEEFVTYAELNRRANRVAHHLRSFGVGPETLVGLCMERSTEMIVGLLGILKAGGAYLPLDPAYPPERLQFMIEDSGIDLLLTLSTTEIIHKLRREAQLAADDLSLVLLDDDWPAIAQHPDENPEILTTPANLAYVIYTSGSTGTPKGVEVLQRGLINHAPTLARALGVGEGDRVLQFITLSFDAAGEEIYPALVSGATLVLIGSAAELVGGRLIHFCAEHDIQVLHLAASIWHQSVDDLASSGETITAPLKALVVGGERPDLERLRTWAGLQQQPMRFVNAYGPTETTITAVKFEMDCDAESVRRLDRIPIGKPIANVQAYILDEQMEPTPIGIPGELYIGGAGVARGYRGRPDLTKERFVPDPFAPDPAARLYKTGDLARWLPDGVIEFLGRVDEQVKIRGFRIELGEIESVLTQQPQVGEAAVVAREDDGHRRLVAYLVARDGQLDITNLRGALQERLPEYMLPAAYVTLDEMPRLPNGKINRRSLPEPTGARHLEKDYVAPRDALEENLAAMWRELLSVEQIGVHDNFFELGGNSLLGATFVNRLQERLDEYVYLVALFDAPTVAELAAYLRGNYAVGVARLLGEDADAIAQAAAGVEQIQIVDESDLVRVRDLIVPLPPPAFEHPPHEAKNPPAVFLLSAPRSGSTLLRVILGGNPRLFAPPELQLLNYNTLEEQQTALGTERDDFWLDGIRRAIMELQDCDVEEAKAIFQSYIDQKLTVKQFYSVLQSWLGDRIFVDKTPNYALDLNMLRRAEEDFADAKYIHLIRHPYAVIPSFEKAKLHVFYPPFLREEHDFTPGQLAELIWVISHQNILAFLDETPPERHLRVHYEELVQQPRQVVGDICRFLDIDFHPDMLEPQKNPKQRMTDGIHPLARMVGDVRFFEHQGIDGRNAYRWKEKLEVDYLGDMTWALAEQLGYDRLQGWPRPADAQTLMSIQRQPRLQDPVSGILQNLPLSFAQERLWFLHQLDPDSASYNVPVALRLQGKLDLNALERSLDAVIRRHEVLHTTFPSVDGHSALRLQAEFGLALQVEDLRNRSEPEEAAERIIRSEAKAPFDLSEGPLLRARVLQLAADEHIFLLTVHHIVADGWSMGIFVQEVAALYRSEISGEAIRLPDLPIQYADYALWQREWLRGAVSQRQLAYWKRQLADSPPLLHLPTDHPRPQEQSQNGAFETFQLPPDVVEGLKRLGREQSATLFMTLMAVFQTLLYRYAGQADFNVGTPVAGRNRSEIEPLIGFFVNTLVLRADFDGDPSFRSALERVRDATVGAFAHQDLPFEMLVDELQPQRAMSHSPLFQVMFVLQDAPVEALQLPDLTLTPLRTDTGTAKFDLTLSMTDAGQELYGLLEYNTDLFEAATIERMIEHFRTLLTAVIADPDQPVSSLPLLTEAERRTLLVDWNDNEVAYPSLCIHDLFTRQAQRTPDATALVFASLENGEEATMTYGELNRKANQVAHYLRHLGLGPDQMVGLMMERSLEMIVGLLGVLKAGAAYVPIDPAYPQDRVSFMLQDAETPVLLTQERLLADLSLNGRRTVCLDRDWPDIARQPDTEPLSEVTPDNLAYVIYTSGSTGQPKGVMIPHSALVNHALSMVQVYELDANDRMLQFITLSF
ncbi:MAG TPA: amino acid adenylation domain-containing protein, partial [Caldilineae bacterium]|nr:amino acid adenylation domain-containing protein [Caldilineae bacterium]